MIPLSSYKTVVGSKYNEQGRNSWIINLAYLSIFTFVLSGRNSFTYGWAHVNSLNVNCLYYLRDQEHICKECHYPVNFAWNRDSL